MAHSGPDWGIVSTVETVYRMDDLGEHAVRLGAVQVHDRRGTVFFYEDFSSALLNRWSTTLEGAGTAAISTATARSGVACCMVGCGNNIGQKSAIEHVHTFPTLGNHGLEVSTSWLNGIDYTEWRYSLFDGTSHIRMYVKYDYQDEILSIMDDNGALQTIASGLKLKQGPLMFHTMKVVGDFVNRQYKRLIMDDVTHDISSYAMYAIPSNLDPFCGIWLGIYNRSGGGLEYAAFDDIILTQNEP